MPQIQLRLRYASLLSKLRMLPCDWSSPGNHCTVLNYHYFSSETPGSYLEVSVKSLAAQLKILSSLFKTFALRESAARLTAGETLVTDRPAISITVDDGCSSFREVLPSFEASGVLVTLFVPVGLCLGTDTLDGLRSWCLHHYTSLLSFVPDDSTHHTQYFEEVMSAKEDQLQGKLRDLQQAPRRPDPITKRKLFNLEQLRSLACHPLITVASHSMSHQLLTALPEAWCRWEVERSLQYVSELGGDSELFAYPYGDPSAINDSTTRLLSLLGVRFAYTTLAVRISRHSQPLSLGRATILDETSFHYIRGTARGAFEFWDRVRFGAKTGHSAAIRTKKDGISGKV